MGETESQQRLDRYSWIRHESIVIKEKVEWSVGFDQRLGVVEQNVNASQPNPVIQSDAPLLAQGVSLDRQLWEWRQGAWVEPRFNLGDWRVVTGVRLQALPLLQSAGVDPRLQIHRSLDWGKWHFGIGRYHQSPPFEQPSLTDFAYRSGLHRNRMGYFFRCTYWWRHLGQAVQQMDDCTRWFNLVGGRTGHWGRTLFVKPLGALDDSIEHRFYQWTLKISRYMESLSVPSTHFCKCHAGLAIGVMDIGCPLPLCIWIALFHTRKCDFGCESGPRFTNMVDVPRRTDAGILGMMFRLLDCIETICPKVYCEAWAVPAMEIIIPHL